MTGVSSWSDRDWRWHEIAASATRPFALPTDPPTVSDFQRARVESAEKVAAAGACGPAGPVAISDLCRVCAEASEEADDLLVVVPREGGRVEYSRSGSTGIIAMPRSATLQDLLHGVAHHLVSPVFPAHGVEWVQRFTDLLRRYAGEEAARRCAVEFARSGVHADAAVRVKRVRKSVVGAINKECGALARIIADGPPRSVLCQLLAIDGDFLVVRDGSGVFGMPMSDLRYVSYRLSESGKRQRSG